MNSKTFLATVAAGVIAGVVVAVVSRRFIPKPEPKGTLA